MSGNTYDRIAKTFPAWAEALAQGVEDYGGAEARRSFVDGIMTEHQALIFVRRGVFEPLEQAFDRAPRLTHNDIDHADGCPAYASDAKFSSADIDGRAQAIDRAASKAARAAGGTVSAIRLRVITGTCERCGGTAKAHAWVVSILWNGRVLSRAYKANLGLMMSFASPRVTSSEVH